MKNEPRMLEKIVNMGIKHLANKYNQDIIDVASVYVKRYIKLQTRYVYQTKHRYIPFNEDIAMGYRALDIVARGYRMKYGGSRK